MNDLFKKVCDYYSTLDAFYEQTEADDTRTTGIGIFVPTPIRLIANGLKSVFRRSLVDKRTRFLDAGSGDGRIVALAASLGLNAYGVEFDEQLVSESNIHFTNLAKYGLNARVIRGDFLDDNTYAGAGISFNEFNAIYNFQNNESNLVRKMALQSPDNVVFLFVGNKLNLINFECTAEIKMKEEADLGDILYVYKKGLRKLRSNLSYIW